MHASENKQADIIFNFNSAVNMTFQMNELIAKIYDFVKPNYY